MTTPLEDYAMIGDGETAALISRNGSIDWLCLPRFDSPACCAALLGDQSHGRWQIRPRKPVLETTQRYRPGTMVLETEMATAGGRIRIVDFMPIRDEKPVLARIVIGLAGTVEIQSDAALRFDYGKMPPWIFRQSDGFAMVVGPDKVLMHATCPLAIEDAAVVARVSLSEGERIAFTIAYGAAHEPMQDGIDTEAALAATEKWWEDWIGTVDPDMPYAEAVGRSLLTLKCLIHRPTGGLVAAPTTSLPEQSGGRMNWDYRYCWLRDATFTLDALIECGFLDEATAWRDWLLRAVAGAPELMQIMYRVDGSRRLDEAELDWLPGYRFARPVRVGNAAAGQLQLDVWGELINTLHVAAQAGMDRLDQGRHLEHAVIDHLVGIWQQPDQGVWESRGEPRHYVHSKAMVWVAFDRFLKGAGNDEIDAGRRAMLESIRDDIHETICREGFDTGLNSFVTFFGSAEVDASLLLLPKVGFLPASDPRMAGTIDLIEQRLLRDGFVLRHLRDEAVPEGAFLACSFWLAECQLGQGREDDARRTFETAMNAMSPLGLMAEEYDTDGKRLAGNYPQALSHLALIHAAIAFRNARQDKS